MALSEFHTSESHQVRSRLDYPVIDIDGHMNEINDVLLDYLKDVGGESLARRFVEGFIHKSDFRWASIPPEERRYYHVSRMPWRATPARNTLDLATSLLPRLLYERMPEMGLDYCIVYPTQGLGIIEMQDEELRRASCRALNRMRADMLREFADRLTPAAVIPMGTPQEAIEELEFCVRELGCKTAMLASFVRRPVPFIKERFPEAASYAYWLDTFALAADTEHDYDSVWAKCAELKIAPAFHSAGMGWGSRRSISNYVYNHIGNFAAGAEAICKALIMGGVPRRFPKLNFAFLEGGMGWARNLYCDLIGHWQKRNIKALANYDVGLVDRDLLLRLMAECGGSLTDGREAKIIEHLLSLRSVGNRSGEDPSMLDEFAPSGVSSAEELAELFADQFFFGCEGDDSLNSLAFRPNGAPFDKKLYAVYGSDIGHWDVPDMSHALKEAYELVERELMSEDEFRDFVFVNPVRYLARVNPDFFKGTAVEHQVARLIREERILT
jgi:predicted TIM-barrel fold metal-dependent hydrolase